MYASCSLWPVPSTDRALNSCSSLRSDFESSAIRVYDGRGDGTPLYTIDKLHKASVHLISVPTRHSLARLKGPDVPCLQYNERYNTVISIDVGGMIEYWEPQEQFEKPSVVEWASKSETGLYEYKKVRPADHAPLPQT